MVHAYSADKIARFSRSKFSLRRRISKRNLDPDLELANVMDQNTFDKRMALYFLFLHILSLFCCSHYIALLCSFHTSFQYSSRRHFLTPSMILSVLCFFALFFSGFLYVLHTFLLSILPSLHFLFRAFVAPILRISSPIFAIVITIFVCFWIFASPWFPIRVV